MVLEALIGCLIVSGLAVAAAGTVAVVAVVRLARANARLIDAHLREPFHIVTLRRHDRMEDIAQVRGDAVGKVPAGDNGERHFDLSAEWGNPEDLTPEQQEKMISRHWGRGEEDDIHELGGRG